MKIENLNNRLFGRTRGRSKKKIDIQKYIRLVSKYKITKLDQNKSYLLDIGTGYGETSIFLANKYKKHTIISCEKYIDGNLNLIKNIQNKNLTNIKLYPGNVIDILNKNIKKQFFDKVWIFFPDPWPKKKHFKRRLISSHFFENMYSFIKNKGEIIVVTDSSSYIQSILNTIYNIKELYKWSNQELPYFDLRDHFELETKYYKKAIISGRKPTLFILKKI